MTAFPGWEPQVLRNLGAPLTSANVKFLDQWQAAEGAGGANNPLNTTLTGYPSSGSVPGTPGVQNYTTPSAGAAAMAATIQSYDVILNALKSGNPYQSQYAGGLTVNFATWTGKPATDTRGAYNSLTASYQAIVNAVNGGKPPQNLNILGSAGEKPGGSVPISQAGGVAGTVATGYIDLTKGVTSTADFLGKITSINFLYRAGEVIFGGLLAFTGLFLLAKQIGLAPGAPRLPLPIPGQAGRETDRAYQSGVRQGELAQARAAGRRSTASVSGSETAESSRLSDVNARSTDYGEVPF